jgi:hypothetical protein
VLLNEALLSAALLNEALLNKSLLSQVLEIGPKMGFVLNYPALSRMRELKTRENSLEEIENWLTLHLPKSE